MFVPSILVAEKRLDKTEEIVDKKFHVFKKFTKILDLFSFQVITSRIGRYPTDWSENEHTTTVLLPGILAALLHTHKQTVGRRDCSTVSKCSYQHLWDQEDSNMFLRSRIIKKKSSHLCFIKLYETFVYFFFPEYEKYRSNGRNYIKKWFFINI